MADVDIIDPPAEILQAATRAGEQHNVPINLLIAVAWVESRYNPTMVNTRTGARGVMQLSAAVAKRYGVVNPLDVMQAMDGAARYLRTLFERFHGWRGALGAYVWGPRHVSECPDATRWPDPVKRYALAVKANAERVRLPFDGTIIEIRASEKWNDPLPLFRPVGQVR